MRSCHHCHHFCFFKGYNQMDSIFETSSFDMKKAIVKQKKQMIFFCFTLAWSRRPFNCYENQDFFRMSIFGLTADDKHQGFQKCQHFIFFNEEHCFIAINFLLHIHWITAINVLSTVSHAIWKGLNFRLGFLMRIHFNICWPIRCPHNIPIAVSRTVCPWLLLS